MTQSNYVGAVYDWDSDKVLVWERGEDGQRVLRRWDAEHYFYVPHPQGQYRSLFGQKLERLDFDSANQLKEHARDYSDKHESDVPPLFKCLMTNYYNRPVPVVNFSLIDIEVDYKSRIGFAGPTNPYGIINAVTIYQSWTGRYKQYVVPPLIDGVRWGGTIEDIKAEFQRLMELKQLDDNIFPDITLCPNEAMLLQHLVSDIQEADIISGWNSEFFDLPYIIKRLQLVLPGLEKKLSFIGARPPKEKQVERFGSPELIYQLFGRTHLDYLDLFRKFTFEGRTSYALANILGDELDIGKLHYEGTLEQLYHDAFPTFCAYNFRDVSGLKALDNKFKFIQLVNQMAHENTCLFENMLGTVRYVETGMTNYAHNVMGVKVPDKRMMTDGEKVEGALVLNPKIGLHDWVGSVDINSLYPSIIRALNISPEKFIGQFAEGEEAWTGIMRRISIHGTPVPDDAPFVLNVGGNDYIEQTAAEWRDILRDQKWSISSYGTVFDQSESLGVVPSVLAFWFAERKRLQADKKKWSTEVKRLNAAIKKNGIDDQLKAELAEAEKQEAHYDLLQLTKKIQLNSTYGALLNVAFRFGRKEMGASVTACGRSITTHMMQTIHGILAPEVPSHIHKTTEVEKDGKVVNVYVFESPIVIYGDTDSCYFMTRASNKEDAVRIADDTAAKTNATFPQFMRDSFNCQPTYDDLIRAGREVVAQRGLFQAKKKYILKVVDLEGFAVDKLKSQGSEIKKSDTPKVIQDFLKEMMSIILNGAQYPEVEAFVNQHRKDMLGKNADVFSMGVSKQVNNLEAIYAAWLRAGRPMAGKVQLPGTEKTQAVPGHVRAAFMYNELVDQHQQGAKHIRSGDKVKIFYLKGNPLKLNAIAFPAELDEFPEWFTTEFQVDKKLTEEKMFDNKLDGIFSAIGWQIPTPQNTHINSIFKF